MLFLSYISTAISFSRTKININEYDLEKYISFRDSLPKNNFLITLSINNTDRYQFYKFFLREIANDISNYVNNDINFSYILLLDSNHDNNFDAVFYVYLPGISEMEVSVYPRLSISYNTNKIIKSCLSQVISLRNLEKELKSTDISRIEEEINELSKIIKTPISNCTIENNYLNDYSSLTEELMHYIPQYKQKKKKLVLQQKIFPEESEQYKILGNEIKKEKKLQKKSKNKDNLTLHKLGCGKKFQLGISKFFLFHIS